MYFYQITKCLNCHLLMYWEGFDWLNSFHPFSSSSKLVLMMQSQIHFLTIIMTLSLFSSMAISHTIPYYRRYYSSLKNNPSTTINQASPHPKIQANYYFLPLHTTNPTNRSTWLFSIVFIMLSLLKTCSKWYRITLVCSLNTFYL